MTNKSKRKAAKRKRRSSNGPRQRVKAIPRSRHCAIYDIGTNRRDRLYEAYQDFYNTCRPFMDDKVHGVSRYTDFPFYDLTKGIKSDEEYEYTLQGLRDMVVLIPLYGFELSLEILELEYEIDS